MASPVRPRESVQVIELTPSPADVADLLIEMTRLDWPTTEEDRQCYFGTLGLHDLGTLPSSGSDEPDTMMMRFSTSLPGVDGTCPMFREEFLGLSLFCYNELLDDGAEARAGYTRLRDHLDRQLRPTHRGVGNPDRTRLSLALGIAIDRDVLLSTPPKRDHGRAQPVRKIGSQRSQHTTPDNPINDRSLGPCSHPPR